MSSEITNESGLTYKSWYRKANAECAAICGLTLDDLPDNLSYDAFISDETPLDYAVMVLEEEGFPFPRPDDDEPDPPRPTTAFPNGELPGGYDTETIITEGGERITVQRNRAANGKHVVIDADQEARNR